MYSTVIWDIDPVLLNIGGYSLRYYAISWMLAFAIPYIVLMRIYRRENTDRKYLDSLTFYVIIGAMVGARLGHCLFYEPDYFLAHPLEIFLPVRIVDGRFEITGFLGLASHGGAIGILLALFLYVRKYKINIWEVADKLGLVAPLGGAFIRLGNLMNSEIIGKATDGSWGFVFTRVDGIPRHPSQLYEAAAYFVIFGLLLYLYLKRKEKHSRGFIFSVSITSIFLARFIIEYSKEVQKAFETGIRHAVGMDMGQLLSLPFILAGIYLMFRSWKPGKMQRLKS